MNYIDQYIGLVQVFKKKLNRELTNKEYGFIVWLVEQQLEGELIGYQGFNERNTKECF